MESTPRRRRALGCLVPLLLLALFAVPARRFFVPQHLSVVSIRAAREFQDPALLERAWAHPAAAAYRRGLFFQSNGSVCGPTSAANVMRTLGEPGATAAAMLAGTGHCPGGVCWGGLTLEELADVVRHHGRRVTVLRPPSRAAFRAELAHLDDPGVRYTLNFDRGPLFGTVSGHHSPLGAYLPAEDLVLVLDVNALYRPWLVRTDRLYDAMARVDPSTGRGRGMLRIE